MVVRGLFAVESASERQMDNIQCQHWAGVFFEILCGSEKVTIFATNICKCAKIFKDKFNIFITVQQLSINLL